MNNEIHCNRLNNIAYYLQSIHLNLSWFIKYFKANNFNLLSECMFICDKIPVTLYKIQISINGSNCNSPNPALVRILMIQTT